MTEKLITYTAEQVAETLTPKLCRETLEAALKSDFDPADDPARTGTNVGTGELLTMPSALGDWAGCKLATVAPNNPDKGLPLINALYCIFDRETLRPYAVLDGSVLTAVRTPAMSAVAVDYLSAKDAKRCVIFGTGLQAEHHAYAMAEVRDLEDIAIIGRSEDSSTKLAEKLAEKGLPARAGSREDIPEADIIVCCTSAKEPLFKGDLVRDGACVVAMGSHTPDARELPGCLIGRSLVAVEAKHTALAEAGDVIIPIDDGKCHKDDLVTMKQVVTGAVSRATDRPNVFKGTGMSWQDIAAAAAVVEKLR
ncbi:ornithine cyclodeaminase family protein [Corynebacterium aquilae]|nr:ornithine cyclodeaminase family protein [Corynebacterium aquilae]